MKHLGILASEEDLLYFDYYAKFIKMGNQAVASCTASEQGYGEVRGVCVFSVQWFGTGIFVFSMNELALKHRFPGQQVITNPPKHLWLPDEELTSYYSIPYS